MLTHTSIHNIHWRTRSQAMHAHSGEACVFTHAYSCMDRWKMLLLPVLEKVQVEGLNFLWDTLLLLRSLFISSIPLNPFFLSSISPLFLPLSMAPREQKSSLPRASTGSPHIHSTLWLHTLPHALLFLLSSAKPSPLLCANPPFNSFVFSFAALSVSLSHCLNHSLV